MTLLTSSDDHFQLSQAANLACGLAGHWKRDIEKLIAEAGAELGIKPLGTCAFRAAGAAHV